MRTRWAAAPLGEVASSAAFPPPSYYSRVDFVPPLYHCCHRRHVVVARGRREQETRRWIGGCWDWGRSKRTTPPHNASLARTLEAPSAFSCPRRYRGLRLRHCRRPVQLSQQDTAVKTEAEGVGECVWS